MERTAATALSRAAFYERSDIFTPVKEELIFLPPYFLMHYLVTYMLLNAKPFITLEPAYYSKLEEHH